jgi:pantoate--beta-alanine ligase
VEIVRDKATMQRRAAAWRRAGTRVGLVPTMGALHAGHLSLLDVARPDCDVLVVSIFVNPLQFGPREDLDRYPRDLAGDAALLQGRGCDLVFAPEVDDMYAAEPIIRIDPGALGAVLCGRSRPGHFQGVATVVAKLFHSIQPDIAVFGQKDAQQLVVLQRMVRDLDWPLRLRVAPIVRDPDGLALSSRNRYLEPRERREALRLHAALCAARAAIAAGERRGAEVEDILRRTLSAGSGLRIDYAAVVDPSDLSPRARLEGRCLLAVAAFVGATRLIDNLVVDVHGDDVEDSDLSG